MKEKLDILNQQISRFKNENEILSKLKKEFE